MLQLLDVWLYINTVSGFTSDLWVVPPDGVGRVGAFLLLEASEQEGRLYLLLVEGGVLGVC